MSTEQSYVGGANNANPIEPTATPQLPTGQNQAQTDRSLDERQAYVQRIAQNPTAAEFLVGLLQRLDALAGRPNPATLLADLAHHWLMQPPHDPTLNPWTVRDTLSLIKLLVELRTDYECFAQEAGEGLRHE